MMGRRAVGGPTRVQILHLENPFLVHASFYAEFVIVAFVGAWWPGAAFLYGLFVMAAYVCELHGLSRFSRLLPQCESQNVQARLLGLRPRNGAAPEQTDQHSASRSHEDHSSSDRERVSSRARCASSRTRSRSNSTNSSRNVNVQNQSGMPNDVGSVGTTVVSG